jgi:stage IV sporulation protein FB
LGVESIKKRVSISIYFAVFIACMLVLDNTGLAPLALLCVLIHECGHITVLHVLHVPIEKVSLRLFGINITLRNGSVLSYRQEAALSLAGSAANFITCAPASLLYCLGIFPLQTGAVFVFSLMLGCFNLLPVASLDGGRALESALCRKMSCGKAEKTVSVISTVLIMPLAAAGVYIVILTGYNISLIAAAVYLAAALVIKSGFIAPLQAKKNGGR